ncbi:MAG: ATP-dependent 6-phosphofructokinase [Imperialibacter sp.]|uniref:6-phosphofructokinase n=1 Tax=Imperialibacter sp. TaxID=2038411 RepID=UPI0032ED1A35
MSKKKLLVLTGGGDCPGLNAVLRGIVKRSQQNPEWEVYGSIEAYNGVLSDPQEIVRLDNKAIAGIHVKGGTIIKTTNKGGPFTWPVKHEDGSWSSIDRSDDLLNRLDALGITAVISIGGDGSQRISQKLYERGLDIVGVPKTIDNDLSGTDFTFGFQTAVQIASDSLDKLVTTAESHHRVMIMEVMGRAAGWIALHTAISGGAEVCLIPEIPYDVEKIKQRIDQRYHNGKGFAHIVMAEGAKPIGGDVVATKSSEVGYKNVRLGGCAYRLSQELKDAGCEADIRETVLGHIQRGGGPIAFDRVLALQFGVKAFEMVLEQKFGRMVAYKHNDIVDVPLLEAISTYNYVNTDSYLVKTARGLGISFGD